MDYMLKFKDEAEAKAVLYSVETGELNHPNTDEIGTIYRPTGEMQWMDDMEVPVMAPIDGWHVNVRSDEVLPELEPFKVNPVPATPSRVWA